MEKEYPTGCQVASEMWPIVSECIRNNTTIIKKDEHGNTFALENGNRICKKMIEHYKLAGVSCFEERTRHKKNENENENENSST